MQEVPFQGLGFQADNKRKQVEHTINHVSLLPDSGCHMASCLLPCCHAFPAKMHCIPWNLGVATLAVTLPLQVFPPLLLPTSHQSLHPGWGQDQGFLHKDSYREGRKWTLRPQEANEKLTCVQMCLSRDKDPQFLSDLKLPQRHMSQKGPQKTS